MNGAVRPFDRARREAGGPFVGITLGLSLFPLFVGGIWLVGSQGGRYWPHATTALTYSVLSWAAFSLMFRFGRATRFFLLLAAINLVLLAPELWLRVAGFRFRSRYPVRLSETVPVSLLRRGQRSVLEAAGRYSRCQSPGLSYRRDHCPQARRYSCRGDRRFGGRARFPGDGGGSASRGSAWPALRGHQFQHGGLFVSSGTRSAGSLR